MRAKRAMRARRSKSCAEEMEDHASMHKILFPRKGLDSDEYSTRRVLRFLEFLGYRDLVLKSDQEAVPGKVLRHAKAH